MAVKFNNYSRVAGKTGTRDYFKWCVFVDEPPEKLAQIKEVEYFLHSSFPEPYQTRSNSADKFALETAGWGEFTLGITVTFKDGKQENLRYPLILDPNKKPWPLEPASHH